MTEDSGYTRRGAILGLGAAATLAACGNDESGTASDQPPANASQSPQSSGMDSKPKGNSGPGMVLGAATEVPVGGAKIYRKQKVVVTQPTSGDFRAFSAVCTHSGCVLSGVQEDGVQCRCHGSLFSKTDGSVVNGVAKEPLPPREISVQDGQITLS